MILINSFVTLLDTYLNVFLLDKKCVQFSDISLIKNAVSFCPVELFITICILLGTRVKHYRQHTNILHIMDLKFLQFYFLLITNLPVFFVSNSYLTLSVKVGLDC